MRLTDAEVDAMLEALGGGESQRGVARRFGVSKTLVQRLVKGCSRELHYQRPYCAEDRSACGHAAGKRRMVFVAGMSDLFHEGVPFEYVAAVFGVMAAAPRHVFQVLTKRPARMVEFFEWLANRCDPWTDPWTECHQWALAHDSDRGLIHTRSEERGKARPWPLPNVWLGVSVEDQATADERIPLLLQCPAAVRWVSYEPALGPVSFDFESDTCHCGEFVDGHAAWDSHAATPMTDNYLFNGIDWVVIGGESGPGARPFDIQWARDTVEACREAGIPCFVKQLGAVPVEDCYDGQVGEWCARPPMLKHRKGADPGEWPKDLRVQEWPAVEFP